MVEIVETLRTVSARKHLTAHIPDMGASAAFWIASQAHTVSIGDLGETGSVGVIAQVSDVSKALEKAGIVVHTLRSGARKALLADPEVTPEALAEARLRIEHVAGRFRFDVMKGRTKRLKPGSSEALRDARLMPAREALALGFVDQIQSQSAAFTAEFKAARPRSRTR